MFTETGFNVNICLSLTGTDSVLRSPYLLSDVSWTLEIDGGTYLDDTK